MKEFARALTDKIKSALSRNRSVLILGARQTGKTTLTRYLSPSLTISFLLRDNRLRFEQNPDLLIGEIQALAQRIPNPLVVLDEVQKVPDIFNTVQYLIDEKIAMFVLTGSSARKITRGAKVNLLPGRLTQYQMDPLTLPEYPGQPLTEYLLFGTLPGIANLESDEQKERDLRDYVQLYLDDEIRAEAAVRQVGAFSHFLELAAADAGKLINFTKLSQQVGVAHTTIQSYYQILKHCLIIEEIPSYQKNNIRRRLTEASKYLFIDLGIRRIAAREGQMLPTENLSHLFEQFIGIELVRFTHLTDKMARVYHWRDHNGPEIDWILECGDTLIPIEVKWTSTPSLKDCRHLNIFLDEHPAKHGIVVCQTPRPIAITPSITAIPWQELWRYLPT